MQTIPLSIIFVAILPVIILFICIVRKDTCKEPLHLPVWTSNRKQL